MWTAAHMAVKDLRLLARDRVALFWAFGFPVLFALFFGAVMRGGVDEEASPARLMFVDEANTPAARALRQRLSAAEGVSVEDAEFEAAEREVRRGAALALLRVPLGYGAGAPGSSAQVEFAADPSRRGDAELVRGTVTPLLALPEVAAKRPSPLVVRELALESAAPANGWTLVLPAALLWGLMGCAAAFAVSMVAERTRGTLVRLRASPIRRRTILAGKALACVMACVADAAVLLVLARFTLDVSPVSLAGLVIALASVVCCFAGITMALAVTGKTEQAVAGAGWSTLIVMAMLGGGMVPLSAMPAWLGSVSDVSPVKWGIVALERAIWRGFTWTELFIPCAVLVGVGAVAYAVGAILFARAPT